MIPSWLAYAVPIRGICRVFSSMHPIAYREYQDLIPADQDAKVQAVIERILESENVEDSPLYERIQDTLAQLPGRDKTIKAWVNRRVKVVHAKTDDYPVAVTGTDGHDGKYYILIQSGLEIGTWQIAHELSHILHEDAFRQTLTKAAASLLTTAAAVSGFGYSFWISLAVGMATNAITHVTESQRAERAADDFAIKHCSDGELREGIAFLQGVKTLRREGTYSKNILVQALYPSEDSRIAKIEAALAATRNTA